MIIFDLDGTLRDTSGSDHLVPEDPTRNENWHERQCHVNKHGLPINQVSKLFRRLKAPIVLTSSQFGTNEWLSYHMLHASKVIERQPDDHRSPFEFKKAFIDKYHKQITLWVDDNPEVLDYVESLGILTVRVCNVIR